MWLGTTTSNMILCPNVTVLLLILERMPCLPALTSTQPMVPTPLEPWATAAMEALITRSEAWEDIRGKLQQSLNVLENGLHVAIVVHKHAYGGVCLKCHLKQLSIYCFC